MSELYWGIMPGAESDVKGRLAAHRAYCAAKGVAPTAGPAMDADRDGLPIRDAGGGLAVVTISGVMVRSVGPWGAFYGLAGIDDTRLAIESALADDDIDQILLRIDSPGGSMAGLSQLGDAISAAEKPITAVIDGVGASAAYYVASHADSIVMGKTDLVGSIGVRMLLYDYSVAFSNEGIEAVPIDTGEHKSAGAMGTEITEAQRAEFQRIVDFHYADFTDRVAGGRGMTTEAVSELADGRMFTPPEALASGLVDSIGTFIETLRDLRSTPERRTGSARARAKI